MIVFAAELKALPLAVFGIVLAVTLGVTYWAAKRTSSASEFYAAGRGITGFQNGWAIAGDYMSASSFLGFAGLIFLFGVDAFVGLMAAIVAFVPVLLFLAERMRNSGKFTLADVLSFRLRERPARVVAAMGTLAIVIIYLVAQMVGAGALIQALTGITFAPAVIIVGAFMLTYVLFGGMLATTWVQIIKATLLMAAGTLLTVLVLAQVGFNPRTPRARRSSSRACSSTPASRCCRSGSRSCSAPPGCRTSSCASSPCRMRRRRAAPSAGPSS
jgi:cation/acetate symporter